MGEWESYEIVWYICSRTNVPYTNDLVKPSYPDIFSLTQQGPEAGST
jgi:hypothetical protein